MPTKEYTVPEIHFYPRPPRGGRLSADFRALFLRCISIHALREEGDVDIFHPLCGLGISIHALREEGDAISRGLKDSGLDFYPRPPRGGRPGNAPVIWGRTSISIHALREEGD